MRLSATVGVLGIHRTILCNDLCNFRCLNQSTSLCKNLRDVCDLTQQPVLFAPSSLAQWFAAVGTCGAVAIALLRDSIRSWWNKPELQATCGKAIPWTVRTPIVVYADGKMTWSGNCYYIRVKIENKGRSRAKKVQVSASRLQKWEELKGIFVDVATILPLNMKWSNSPFGSPITILDGISPKMSVFCDVFSLCHPDNPYQRKPSGTQTGKPVGQLQLEVDLPADMDLLPQGKYRLNLRIAAGNAKPIDKVLTFEHTGVWKDSDDEMRRDCLSVALT